MEDSSNSSSDDSCSSSTWKGDRVAMCSVANREPVLRSREFDPRPFLQYGRHRQGDEPGSNPGGVVKGSEFDSSAFRLLSYDYYRRKDKATRNESW